MVKLGLELWTLCGLVSDDVLPLLGVNSIIWNHDSDAARPRCQQVKFSMLSWRDRLSPFTVAPNLLPEVGQSPSMGDALGESKI